MSEPKKFKYEQYLSKFKDVVDAEYSEKTVTAYRTVIEIPPNEKDQTPLTLREEKGVLRYEAKLTEKKLALQPYDVRKILVGNIGLSCNDTPEAAIESVRKQINRTVGNGLKAGISEDDVISEIMKYRDSRGRYIIKCDFTPDAGQFSEFEKGHCNYHPYEGVDIETYRDKEFNPIEIDYTQLSKNAIRNGKNI